MPHYLARTPNLPPCCVLGSHAVPARFPSTHMCICVCVCVTAAAPACLQLTTWDKGEYPNSNNDQDDIAIINETLPLLPVIGGPTPSIATAAPLTRLDSPPDPGVDAGVVVGTDAVVANIATNYHSFGPAAAGPIVLSVGVVPSYRGGVRTNLVVGAWLYDASGAQVAGPIRPPGFNTTLRLSVPPTVVNLPAAGSYVVGVSGVGSPAGGYTRYNTRGEYALRVTFKPASTGGKIRATGIPLTRVCNTTHCTCSVRMTLVNAATSAAAAGVRLRARWTSRPAVWSPTIQTGTSNSIGVVRFSAKPQLRRTGTASACTLSLLSIASPAGFALDASSVWNATLTLPPSATLG